MLRYREKTRVVVRSMYPTTSLPVNSSTPFASSGSTLSRSFKEGRMGRFSPQSVYWSSCTVVVCWGMMALHGAAIRARPHLQGLDVSIVGGGIAGLACAVSLKTITGINARVYEADEGYRNSGYGLVLCPNGLRALHHMDVPLHDEVIRAGSAIGERVYSTDEGTHIDYCREREKFGHPMTCLRSLSLYNALRRAAIRLGCEIVPGAVCKSITPALFTVGDGDRQATLVLSVDTGGDARMTEVVQTDLIIGADGLNSLVRSYHGDTDKPRDAECLWFHGMVSHATCPILDRTRVHAFLLHEPTKTALLMPVGDHTYWTAALTGADREEAMDVGQDFEATKHFLQEKLDEDQMLAAFIESTPANQIHRRSIKDRPAMNSFVSGVTTGDFHSVLVGDAAHPSRPSVGQGANMALEDAVQFALLLRETESVKEALRQYDAARVLRCAILQGDPEFVERRRERQSGSSWLGWGKDRRESRCRSANKEIGDPEFVYNWHPTGLHHHPWRSR